MICSRFDDLRREKSYKEKRNLSLRTIAQETGLAVGTVQRLNNGDMERVYLSTLDTLCGYFGLKEVGELIEYVPGGDAASSEKEAA